MEPFVNSSSVFGLLPAVIICIQSIKTKFFPNVKGLHFPILFSVTFDQCYQFFTLYDDYSISQDL